MTLKVPERKLVAVLMPHPFIIELKTTRDAVNRAISAVNSNTATTNKAISILLSNKKLTVCLNVYLAMQPCVESQTLKLNAKTGGSAPPPPPQNPSKLFVAGYK